ncbi:MAG: alpha/beta hydrolase [Clostridia bacterium]|nr:alpha/beta hydrolase [Clostridia bacterium]
MKRIIAFIVTAAIVLCCIPMLNASAADRPELKEYGFVDCGGANIEYGIYGDMNAEALLLLPPNNGDMHCFDWSVLPELANHYKVITVSPRGTGKSDYIAEDGLSFELMSDDLIYLLDYLGVEKTRIFGFSDGGNLGLVFTVNHQERVHSLAIMGSNINPFGTKFFDQVSIIWRYLGFYLTAAFSQNTSDLIRRDIQGLMVFHPTLTFDDLKTIKVPVLNIYGEDDMMYRSHSQKITQSIEGAKEIMIEGAGHSSGFDFTDTIINPALLEFFADENSVAPETPDSAYVTTDIAEVVEMYNNAVINSRTNPPTGFNRISLGSDIDIEDIPEFITDTFASPVKRMLKENSLKTNAIPGNGALNAEDVTLAKAVTKNGITTIDLMLKSQTDPADSSHGAVSRGIGTFGSIDSALKLIDSSVVSGREDISLNYSDAVIHCKVDSNTGAIINGKWNYRLEMNFGDADLKFAFLPFTLSNVRFVFNFDITI